jgi:hypothetical protein
MKRETKFKFYSPYKSILFLETRTHVTFQHRLATLYILIDSESSTETATCKTWNGEFRNGMGNGMEWNLEWNHPEL